MNKNADLRYNTPKEEPKTNKDKINKTIRETEIYRRAQMAILEAQSRQVGYGLDKYPEPLNANTWDILETIDHIIDESIDKLHYLVMLRIKEEERILAENVQFRNPHITESTTIRGGQDFDGDKPVPKMKHDDYLDALRYTTGIDMVRMPITSDDISATTLSKLGASIISAENGITKAANLPTIDPIEQLYNHTEEVNSIENDKREAFTKCKHNKLELHAGNMGKCIKCGKMVNL